MIYSGKTNQKFTVLNLFEIPGALFSADSWRSKNLNEKANIYFHDYTLANLIIQVSNNMIHQVYFILITKKKIW